MSFSPSISSNMGKRREVLLALDRGCRRVLVVEKVSIDIGFASTLALSD